MNRKRIVILGGGMIGSAMALDLTRVAVEEAVAVAVA